MEWFFIPGIFLPTLSLTLSTQLYDRLSPQTPLLTQLCMNSAQFGQAQFCKQVLTSVGALTLDTCTFETAQDTSYTGSQILQGHAFVRYTALVHAPTVYWRLLFDPHWCCTCPSPQKALVAAPLAMHALHENILLVTRQASGARFREVFEPPGTDICAVSLHCNRLACNNTFKVEQLTPTPSTLLL